MISLWVATSYLLRNAKKLYYSLITALPAAFMSAVSLTYILMADEGMGLFSAVAYPSGTAMEVGIRFLQILSPFYFVVSTKLVSDGVLRGAGMMKQFMAATFTDLILRVVFAKILSAFFGTTGIWLAWPLGWTVAMGMSVMFYHSGAWNKKMSGSHFGHPMKGTV